MKCIKPLTWCLYIFYFLLCRIESGYGIPSSLAYTGRNSFGAAQNGKSLSNSLSKPLPIVHHISNHVSVKDTRQSENLHLRHSMHSRHHHRGGSIGINGINVQNASFHDIIVDSKVRQSHEHKSRIKGGPASGLSSAKSFPWQGADHRQMSTTARSLFPVQLDQQIWPYLNGNFPKSSTEKPNWLMPHEASSSAPLEFPATPSYYDNVANSINAANGSRSEGAGGFKRPIAAAGIERSKETNLAQRRAGSDVPNRIDISSWDVAGNEEDDDEYEVSLCAFCVRARGQLDCLKNYLVYYGYEYEYEGVTFVKNVRRVCCRSLVWCENHTVP